MKISESLQQIYFLGVNPEKQIEVASHLLDTPLKAEEKADPWHLYARLARPGLVAMRTVRRTTGLDLFLLDAEMDGVEDVAEIMGYGLENGTDTGGIEEPEPFTSSWKHFETVSSREPCCLFLTFLRLNWDVLTDRAVWSQYGLPPPGRTQVLRAVTRALKSAVDRAEVDATDKPLHFHVSGGTGDCDLFITGLVNTRHSLDRFLLILAQLGTDSLAAAMAVPPEQVRAMTTWYPVCAASTTELAVPWSLYKEVLNLTCQTVATAADAPPQATATDEPAATTDATPSDTAAGKLEWTLAERDLAIKINRYLSQGLRSAVFLRRTRSFLMDVRHEITAISPPDWVLQVVIGDADMLLRRKEAPLKPTEGTATATTAQVATPDTPAQDPESLSNLLLLLGRLDGKGALNKDFPRRIAVVLSFDGYAKTMDAQGKVKRSNLLPLISDTAEPQVCPVLDLRDTSEKDLKDLAGYLRRMLQTRRREEYRILERMVERAVTLQRQADVSHGLRILARLTLQRLARFLNRNEDDEREYEADDDEEDDERAIMREQIVRSGMHLDRTLAHHARGSVPLLLSTVSQARATDHFGSETILTTALGAPAASVARRLLSTLKGQTSHYEGDAWESLTDTLRDMSQPILYASHDLDFELVEPLGMIRVPRWVIWYPTASASVLHEVGHAVMFSGKIRVQADHIIAALLGPLIHRSRADRQKVKLLSAQRTLLGKSGPPGPTGLITRPPVFEPTARIPAIEWVEPLMTERIDSLGKPSSSNIPLEDWRGQLDEITAELFCHCFSYSRTPPTYQASTRHIYDAIEHIAPLCHRMCRAHRLLFICRELAVRIALRLMDASATGTSPWKMTHDEIYQIAYEEMDIFRKSLSQWLTDAPPPFNDDPPNVRLEQDVADIQFEAKDFQPLDSLAFPDMYRTNVGRAIQWGIFVALLATSAGHVPATPGDPVWVTQQLWQAIESASRAPDQAPAEDQEREKRIIQQLRAGHVPGEISQWPERLPRSLHARLRQDNTSVHVPQRFALTLALADWMIVNHEPSQAKPS